MKSLLDFDRKACRMALDEWERQGREAGATGEAQIEALSAASRAHFAGCAACREKLQEGLETQRLLGELRYALEAGEAPGSFFATRVMAAIRERESEEEAAARTWAFLPKMTAGLAGVTALLLLLTVVWYHEMPRPAVTTPAAVRTTSVTPDGLFDNAPTPATQDEALVSLVERDR
jgi:hypothetical protein